jgi:hypothetical protein
MEENLKCYHFEEIHFKKGELDEVLDATYIIHLKDNGRFESVMKNLTLYQPSKLVYIVFNEGFKNCKKSDFIKLPCDDLIDANLQILKHANKMNYNNILVLEDDYFFDDKIKQQPHKNNLIYFLNSHQHLPYLYSLGCMPMLMVPYNFTHYWPVLSGGTHAVIYNMKIRDIIINTKQQTILDWDEFCIWNNYKYTYYTPLCYQLFPETENSKSWGKNNSNLINYCKQLGPKIIRLLNLDKQVEPGYTIVYIFSKLIFWVIIVLILYFIWYLFKKLLNFKNKKISLFSSKTKK